YVWQNSFITEPLRRFIDNPEIIEKIFDSLTPRDIKASDPMFYLSRLAPVFVLYFCLCLLGHKDQVHKLDPLFDLLAMGVVPHHIEMIEDKTGEVCLCGESRICVAVERDLEK
ncbi:MAG: hypothetical protein HY226_01305, partial [Candidatus Vogelbacteria bacterium]|nr:hypothetical protein [Candidatus Vogelbacteria bacterium]